MTRPLYIFDLDGTLADLTHRRHFVALQDGSKVTGPSFEHGIYRGMNPNIPGDYWIEIPGTGKWSFDPDNVNFKPDWDAFHAACVHDKPIKHVLELVEQLWAGTAEIWIWSGRMETVRNETVQWFLRETNLPAPIIDTLKMRPAKNYTVDYKLKESWLLAMKPEDRARLRIVFDDRDQVVQMWRSHGVPCFQVAPGDF